MLALLGARGDLGNGASGYRSAMAAACRGDRDEAAFMLQQSSRAFARADARLSNPVVSLGLAVPVVNSNLAAARALADTGQASPRQTGLRIALVSATDGPLSEEPGTLQSASGPVSPGQARLKNLDAPFLMPQLHEAVVRLDSALSPRTLAQAGSCPALVGPEQVRSSPGEPTYVVAGGVPGGDASSADSSSRSPLPENVSSPFGSKISLIRNAEGSDATAGAVALGRAGAPVPVPVATALGPGAPAPSGAGASPSAGPGPMPQSTPPRSTPPKPTPPRSTPRQNDNTGANTRPRPVSPPAPKPVFEPPRPSGGRSVHAAGNDPARPRNRGQGNRDRDGKNRDGKNKGDGGGSKAGRGRR